jgi:glycosyltransferase involved in cell wall biosynthesis
MCAQVSAPLGPAAAGEAAGDGDTACRWRGVRQRSESPAPQRALSGSVVIATMARPQQLRSVLECCIGATEPAAELIVVDGDPHHSAGTVVSDLRARHRCALRYLTSRPGIALQRNVGLDAARGDVVIFLDDDCLFDPPMLGALLAAYRDPAVMGATGLVLAPARSRLGSDAHSRLRWLVLGAGRQGSVTRTGFRRPIVEVDRARDVEYMPGPLMSARRSVAAQVRFDERLTGYGLGEDDDFSYRLSRLGRIRYEPAAVVVHSELGWERKDRRKLDRLRVENRAYLFRKNFPQTLTSKLAFAGLMLLHCAHRTVNREWSGLAGLLEGLWREFLPVNVGRRARARS